MPAKKFVCFLSIPVLLFFSYSCKKQESNPSTESKSSSSTTSLSAVVIFAVGEIKSGDKKLNLGDVVKQGEVLTTGKKSLCDLQIVESEAGVVIRVKSDSEFILNSSNHPEAADVNMTLKLGSALFKVNNKLKKEQSVRVTMPTMVAGVRGTSFSTEVSKKGDASIQVVEGSVATRPSISELENLPEEIKSGSASLQTVTSSLEAAEQVVGAGEKVSITKASTDKILKDTGLKNTLPLVKAALEKKDNAGAIAAIDGPEASKAESKTKLQEKLASLPPIKKEKANDKELQKQLKEFEELIAIEKQKLENEPSLKTEISKRNQGKNDVLLKRIEEITGRSSETLILKSGERIQGVIFQEGNTYHVLTADGKKSFPESSVEGTEF